MTAMGFDAQSYNQSCVIATTGSSTLAEQDKSASIYTKLTLGSRTQISNKPNSTCRE